MDISVIHMLRHGEVENPDGVIYERLPGFHLSERGHKMAKTAANFIAEHDELNQIKCIYVSPLKRTKETASYVSKIFPDIPVVLEDRIIESEHRLAGKNPKEYTRNLLKRAKLRELYSLYNAPFMPSWGESYVEIARRMGSAIRDVRKKYTGEHALIVSHQSPIWHARLSAENRTFNYLPFQRQCALASVTSLYFDEEADELIDVKYYDIVNRQKM